MIGAIAVLIGVWWIYANWESDAVLKVRNMLGLVPVDIPKQIDEPTIAPDLVLPDSISLNKTVLTFNKANAYGQLTAIVFPPEVLEENKKVIWQSSNEAVAKVDTTGLVTAVANGQAVITAFTGNGLSDACSVQVKIVNSSATGPTPAQINNLLNKIANSDDKATDDLRKVLGNGLRVEGAANISNVQQLITDVSNGTRYKVSRVNTNDEGKLVSITVSKQ